MRQAFLNEQLSYSLDYELNFKTGFELKNKVPNSDKVSLGMASEWSQIMTHWLVSQIILSIFFIMISLCLAELMTSPDPVLISGLLCQYIHGAKPHAAAGNLRSATKDAIWVSAKYLSYTIFTIYKKHEYLKSASTRTIINPINVHQKLT